MSGNELNLLVLGRYSTLGASSRVRMAQYFPVLQKHSIQIHFKPLLDDAYLQNLYANRRQWGAIAAAYGGRVFDLAWSSVKYDAIWLEKELLPWAPAFFERILLPSTLPLILDMDDAIFHQYDLSKSGLVRTLFANKIDELIKTSSAVIVGSQYLAERAERVGARRVVHIPSSVQIYPLPARKGRPETDNRQPVIGWIGSPSTAKYLQHVEPALREIVHSHRAKVVCIGLNKSPFSELQVELRPWALDSEMDELDAIDVGIMPLTDGPWERGKCAYKLIQYFSRSKPAVASPVGENLKVIEHGINGFLAKSPDDWCRSLASLLGSETLRLQMGRNARLKAEREFDATRNGIRIAEVVRSVCNVKDC